MRGTPSTVRAGSPTPGIIPAYAGNTRIQALPDDGRRDHPRVCGEHMMLRAPSVTSVGSSPRMRGTPLHVGFGEHVVGIIPAYAGNTTRSAWRISNHGDHPRVCGEHFLYDRFAMKLPGSSPRMRGTLQSSGIPRHISGIIPAYAGNTQQHVYIDVFTGDHPRVCGEHHCI